MLPLDTFPDPQAVQEALSLGRGATVRHGIDVLDAADQPTGEALRFESASVSWDYRAADRVVGQSTDLRQVRRRATLNLLGDVAVNLYSRRLRLWTEWRLANGTWQRFPLGVFEVVTPAAIDDDGLVIRRTVQMADKSYRWANDLLDNPLVVPAATAVVDYVKTSLRTRYAEARFAIAGSTDTLAQERVFETGTSWLEVYSALLAAIGYDQLIANELGHPASHPLATLAARGVEHRYGAGLGKVLTAGQVEPLLPTLPNVVRFSARQGPSLGNVIGNGLAERRNQSTGPASIDARGRQVVLRVDVDADSQAVLEAIADADAQRYFAGGGLRWSGRVGLNPRHSDRDVIGLELPRLDLTGQEWLVTHWTYPLAPLTSESQALMQITAERRVAL